MENKDYVKLIKVIEDLVKVNDVRNKHLEHISKSLTNIGLMLNDIKSKLGTFNVQN